VKALVLALFVAASTAAVAADLRGTADLGIVVERAAGSVQVIETTGNSALARVEDPGDLSHASAVFSRDGRYAYVFGRDGGLSKSPRTDAGTSPACSARTGWRCSTSGIRRRACAASCPATAAARRRFRSTRCPTWRAGRLPAGGPSSPRWAATRYWWSIWTTGTKSGASPCWVSRSSSWPSPAAGASG